jgi:RHS repeat-associated protein
MWKRDVDVAAGVSATTSNLRLLGMADSITFTRGNKLFELTNHLGNVLTTISDKRSGVLASSGDTTVAYYNADVISANDYYPFGSQQPGRAFAKVGGVYRYGFNGQEKDNETNASGDSYTALFWEYDSRIGRRWNLDPKPAVGISQYATFSNSPIRFADPLGDTTTIVDKNNRVLHVNMHDKGHDIVRLNKVDYAQWEGFLKDEKSDKSVLERMAKASGEKIGQTIFGFDFMLTLDRNNTFTTPAYGTNIDNPIPSELKKGDIRINLAGVKNGKELIEKLNDEFVNVLTPWEGGYLMLKDLKRLSTNKAILDIKETLMGHGNYYAGIKLADNTYTTVRVLGNMLFGMNVASARDWSDGKEFFYKLVMKDVGEYNQKTNGGNGYNAGWPFYGEHTLSGSAIFLGYFGKKP